MELIIIFIILGWAMEKLGLSEPKSRVIDPNGYDTLVG